MLSDLRTLSTVHMDETTLQCLALKGRSTSYMVCAVSGRYEQKQMALYHFFEGRSQTFVPEVLGPDFDQALMSDGLQAYANYTSAVHLECMAHARRGFYHAISVRDDYAEYLKLLKSSFANQNKEEVLLAFFKEHQALDLLLQTLDLFDELYLIERHFQDDPLEVLAKARNEASRSVFNRIVEYAQTILDGFEKGTKAWRAASYFLTRQDELSRYLDNPEWPIDNNLCERKIKTFVVARKNFLFANSVDGANLAAGYMTLLVSAEMNGLNPYAYIEYVLNRLKYYKDTEIPEEVLKELTPYSGLLPEELKSR